MTQPKVILVRGLPGSGKSTWLHHNFDRHNPVTCSADDFFMVNGEFKYDHSRIDQAHAACLKAFWDACHRKEPLVLVDNVFQRLWQISPYLRIGELLGYNVELVQVYCPNPWEAWGRNIHGIPRDKFEWVLRAFEKAPRSWHEKKYRSGQTYQNRASRT